MTEIQIATLLSAVLGMAGTAALFFGSYALQPYEGAAWGSPEVNAANQRIRAANVRRVKTQRTGLGLLCLSFIVQAASAFLPASN